MPVRAESRAEQEEKLEVDGKPIGRTHTYRQTDKPKTTHPASSTDGLRHYKTSEERHRQLNSRFRCVTRLMRLNCHSGDTWQMHVILIFLNLYTQ